MINQCNFAGYIATEPKQFGQDMLGVTLMHKKKYNGQEKVTWISITLTTKKAYWLKDLQKGDYLVVSNAEYQTKEYQTQDGETKTSHGFFAFTAESPTLQARSNQGSQQSPDNQPDSGDFIEDSIPF